MYQTTERNTPGDLNLHHHRRENLRMSEIEESGRVICLFVCVCLFLALQPTVGQVLLIHYVRRTQMLHQNLKYPFGRVINTSWRTLPDNTQQYEQINIHALGGIRTHNHSRRAAAHLRLRPRGHWDRR